MNYFDFHYDVPVFKENNDVINIDDILTFEEPYKYDSNDENDSDYENDNDDKNDNDDENDDENVNNDEYEDYEELNDDEKIDMNEEYKADEIEENMTKLKEKEHLFYQSLINTFMIYYNEKYEKNDTILTFHEQDIETNIPMTLFYDVLCAFKKYKDDHNLTADETKRLIYEKNEYTLKKIENDELYCLDFLDATKEKLYSPLLVNCLYYVVVYKLEKWRIYSLKNY